MPVVRQRVTYSSSRPSRTGSDSGIMDALASRVAVRGRRAGDARASTNSRMPLRLRVRAQHPHPGSTFAPVSAERQLDAPLETTEDTTCRTIDRGAPAQYAHQLPNVRSSGLNTLRTVGYAAGDTMATSIRKRARRVKCWR